MMSGTEVGFSQVSVIKMTSGMWVVLVSQISAACLPSERALSRMQWSSPVAPASVGGMWVVVFAVLLKLAVA